nr:hypothetical protein [Tanacetum cinerariifolium]
MVVGIMLDGSWLKASILDGLKVDFYRSKPHPPYDFFALGPLPGYAGNPNNNNGWINVDIPLLGELGVVADEQMVGLIVDEIAKLIVEMEEQMIAPVIDAEENIAMLFGDDDFSDDDSEGVEEEVWEVNEEWLMAPLVKKVIQVSDAEVAAGVSIKEIGPRIGTQVEQGQQTATQGDDEIAGLTQQVQALQAVV